MNIPFVWWTISLLAILLCDVNAFVPPSPLLQQPKTRNHNISVFNAKQPIEKNDKIIKKKKKEFTIADLQKELLANPAKFQPKIEKKKKYRRTRKRVEQPKQTYVYAAQRKKQLQQKNETTTTDDVDVVVVDENDVTDDDSNTVKELLRYAKEIGLQPSTQHCDPNLDDIPIILGQIKVGDSDTAGSYAYLIQKPIGWSVVGSSSGGSNSKSTSTTQKSNKKKSKKMTEKQKIRIKEKDGTIDVLEYSEADILALLTPEEREEYEAENNGKMNNNIEKEITIDLSEQERNEEEYLSNDDNDDFDDTNNTPTSVKHDPLQKLLSDYEDKSIDPQTEANLRRIAMRLETGSNSNNEYAIFAPDTARPSVVAWLKDLKATEGTPIRGGNYWTAVAGAVEVDDSGIVLIAPKKDSNNLFVEFTEYVASVGNGGYLAPKIKKVGMIKTIPSEDVATRVDVLAKVKKGRLNDIVQTVKVTIPEKVSTSANVIEICQNQFKDGIRGDPFSNPFDRRSFRRLIHCSSMSVSSLNHDEHVQVQIDDLPDDIANLAERRNHLEYTNGSFLGRSQLQQSTSTTAYREINGAADGFPGWTVDRYGKWLIVYHDPQEPKGPLPSIHDGNTAGVYYLESIPDRNSMGSGIDRTRPRLLEGQSAPDYFEILENDVKYMVSINRDLSTGIFLDQRPQRLWLLQNCCPDTRVLNCFAHTGAFSIAAAKAGATTVSLDLSKKWLDRLPIHLQANGIEYNERHDCIYGDCFDWLTRLAKRNEKYDIVILDPPSSSVGGKKKKRWSIKNDMDELVTLASTLVKHGGILWTTTNSASISTIKFARLCRKGLHDAGIDNPRLERIQPMPIDFPCIGTQPVKNLIWRIP